MKKVKFAVGDRVGHAVYDVEDRYGESKVVKGIRVSEYGEAPDYGTVTDILSSGKVVVKWDSEWKNRRAAFTDPSELMLESDIKTEYSRLDKEFDEVKKQVKAKMKEAGKIIADAHKLAQTTGNNLQELYDAIQPLEDAMDKAGWHTSSWGC